jgi:secreted trypsin-like serine protease
MIQRSLAVLSALLVTLIPYATGNLDDILATFHRNGATEKRIRPETDRVVGLQSKGVIMKKVIPAVDMDEYSRVVGGEDVDPILYPFFTFVQIDKTDASGEFQEFCAGTLIAPDIVQTAAHCFIEGDVASITVRVNNTSVNETGFDYLRAVTSHEVHPDFDEVTYNNDVAILYLSVPVTEVTPIAINGDAAVPMDGQDAILLGMGSLEENGTFPEFLQVATLQSVNYDTCVAAWSDTAEGAVAIDPILQLCAAAPGKDACDGDSGGPLFIASGSSYALVGTVSFGIGCALPVSGFPLVTVWMHLEFGKNHENSTLCVCAYRSTRECMHA